jgi:CBS domain-containing protein
MTVNPDCATLDTTILDALHILHDGKFLHIPVLDGGRIRTPLLIATHIHCRNILALLIWLTTFGTRRGTSC